MRSPRRRRLLVPAALMVCVASLVLAAGTQARSSDQGRQLLPGTKPAWTSAVATTGAVSATQQVHAKVWLAPRDATKLDALARAVSDPSSPQYGQYLKANQYRAQFAPTADQVGAVRQWLEGAGLKVDEVGPDAHYVAVSGTAAAASEAFGAQLAHFTVNGTETDAPTSDFSVPDAVASSVLAITGLTTFGHMIKPIDFGPPNAFVNARPCSIYYGQQTATDLPAFKRHTLPWAVCGYTPRQFRGAYGINGIHGTEVAKPPSGEGSAVAITDAFDASTLLADANQYSTRHHDKTFAEGQFSDLSVPEDPSKQFECGGNGWYGEQTLDIEAVHGMAQGAQVLYYGAASCYDDDLLASLSRVVSDNTASIVTNSWGEPTYVVIDGVTYPVIDQTIIDAYESVFKQGAAQGIGFYFSSGDSGDELANWGVAAPDWPTEDPWVTSVGGTSLAIGQDNARLFETGWGTAKWNLTPDRTHWKLNVPFLYGAGGGFTVLNGSPYFGFDRPFYQVGVVPDYTQGRGVPDIAMDGDPTTGMLVGETQYFALKSRYGPAGVHYGEYRIGGTSLSSPLFAGVQAVAQSRNRSFGRIGFSNPLIYLIDRSSPSSFFDVTPQGDLGNVRADFLNKINGDGGLIYSVRTFDQDSSLTVGPGWDDVTGVGSPTAEYLNLLSR